MSSVNSSSAASASAVERSWGDLLARQLPEGLGDLRGPARVEVPVGGVVGGERLAQPLPQMQVPRAALDRHGRPRSLGQGGDGRLAVQDDQGRGCQVLPLGADDRPVLVHVSPNRCERARRRPADPDLPVSPARCGLVPFLGCPARTPVPSSRTTSGTTGCAGVGRAIAAGQQGGDIGQRAVGLSGAGARPRQLVIDTVGAGEAYLGTQLGQVQGEPVSAPLARQAQHQQWCEVAP